MYLEMQIQDIQNGQTVNMIVYLDSSDPKTSVVRDEVNSTAKLIPNHILYHLPLLQHLKIQHSHY